MVSRQFTIYNIQFTMIYDENVRNLNNINRNACNHIQLILVSAIKLILLVTIKISNLEEFIETAKEVNILRLTHDFPFKEKIPLSFF